MASGADTGEPMMLTYKQAWTKLGVSESQFYRLLRSGEIEPLKLAPRVRRVTQADLDAYLKKKVAERDAEEPAA